MFQRTADAERKPQKITQRFPRIVSDISAVQSAQVISDSTLSKGSKTTLDINQVGSRTAGADITVQLMVHYDMERIHIRYERC